MRRSEPNGGDDQEEEGADAEETNEWLNSKNGLHIIYQVKNHSKNTIKFPPDKHPTKHPTTLPEIVLHMKIKDEEKLQR